MRRLGLGSAISLVSLLLAFGWSFDHFYELLLLGLLLLLSPFVPSGAFTRRAVSKAYVLFFVAGVVVDLVLGIWIAGLWHYSYTHIAEYVLLYVWVYPAGGFVLVQSYLIALRYLPHTIAVHVAPQTRVILALLGIAASALSIALIPAAFRGDGIETVLFFMSAVAALCAFGSFVTELRGRPSYARDILERPLPVASAILFATMINLVVHEFPNLFAGQWVYTVHTDTVLDTAIIGIPLGIWILWPFLTMGSMTLYAFVRPHTVPKAEALSASARQ